MVNLPKNHSAAQNRGLTSLRRTLFRRFGLLGVGALLLFTLAYIVFGLFPLINQIAASHFDTTIESAQGSIRETLFSAETVVRIASEWAGPEGLEADQPEIFNKQFAPILETMPQATSIVAGTTDGLGWLLLQRPDGWHNRFTNIPERGDEQLYVEWQNDLPLQRYFKRVDYDPRQRLWFKIAMSSPANGRPHWTAPYKFFTTGEPGITVSIRRDLPDKRSLVVGIDLKLIDISSITAGLSVGKQGYVLVLTDSGNILGLPRDKALKEVHKGRDIILRPAEELGLEPVNAALTLWRENKTSYLQPDIINVFGQRWFFVMHPLLLGEQTFWIAAFAPITDFLPSLFNIGQALAASLALVLAFTFIAARRQARRISLPLEALAAASSKVAQLDFSESPPITTRWHETNALVMAQANMLAMLRNFQATVNSQAAELKDQVDVLHATQEQLQRTLLQEQEILDNAMSGILFVKDRKIIRSNLRAVEIFGFDTISQMLGHSTEFMYENYEKFLVNGELVNSAFFQGESYCEELLLKRRDGGTFWGYMQGRASGSADRVAGGAVWTVTDLTERKEMDRMKNEMLSVVGHEVRTPLTGMMGYAELMMDMEFPLEQRREFLGIIYHETERLAELFDNFLNLQTLKNDTASNYQTVNLEGILKEAVDLFRGASKKHSLDFACQADLPVVQGDAEELHRVFLNLISNAIKYSPEGGTVSVSVCQSHDSVLVRVEDEGIGIPPSAQERIFESFFRVDNSDNRRIGGTGLGLAVVMEIVKKHGGKVWVESQVGKGSTFFVSLPAAVA